jgi:polyisoprenoid-binding protein YceI
MQATIHVFTFREGLLGKLGHDLRLSLSRFDIRARGSEIVAQFEPSSLSVDGAVVNGRVDASVPSAADRKKIHDTLCSEVLRTREHPEVRLQARTTSRVPPYRISGTLTLCGVSRTINLVLEDKGERLIGALEINPSHWGVKPYRALGGALRVSDRVIVSIDASADWLHAGGELNPAVELHWTSRERPSLYPPRAQLRSRLPRDLEPDRA